MTSNRDRVGIAIFPRSAEAVVDLCVRAERANVSNAWFVMPATALDTLTLLGAAAMKTERITLGTTIVPAFTRHPLAFVTQALALEGLAPGRFDLGIGSAHARTMVDVYHVDFDRPLRRLVEYLQIVQPALKTGAVHFEGEFYRADASFPHAPGTPVPIAALRAPAFRVAGRLADGAMSWNCPTAYIQQVAMPALQDGADSAGRDRPRLMVHVPVMVTTDRDEVHRKAGEQLRYYAAAPFYARMFADAGYPLLPDGGVSPELIDDLVVGGTPDEIAAQLRHRLDLGFDVLMVNPLRTEDDARHEDQVLEILGRM
ncbi:MAG TPA: LLM class flavin-dependent oxidoreductase [Thermomicrobiales bacterium]|nr:LLM class flavin-dependent oxidoreductase [Thermomicrobiales bacterium]